MNSDLNEKTKRSPFLAGGETLLISEGAENIVDPDSLISASPMQKILMELEKVSEPTKGSEALILSFSDKQKKKLLEIIVFPKSITFDEKDKTTVARFLSADEKINSKMIQIFAFSKQQETLCYLTTPENSENFIGGKIKFLSFSFEGPLAEIALTF